MRKVTSLNRDLTTPSACGRHPFKKLKGNFSRNLFRFSSLTVLRSYGLTLLLLLTFCMAYGQTGTNELPYSWEKDRIDLKLNSIPVVNLPNLDLEALAKEDLINDGSGTPYRFGYSHEVSLTLNNSGVWQTTSDGGRLWCLRIYSPDALSLNLLYNYFWLPEGAKFFLYSEDKKQSIGAFTSYNNKGDRSNIKGFATSFLFTKNIVLEYYEPADVEDNGIISISKIISGYRNIYDFGKKNRDWPIGTPPCFPEINCSAGYEWQTEKDAIALMVMGKYSCSGALLNNTANDGNPLFLTADHCFSEEDPESSQWVFYWNFEISSPDCDKIYIDNPITSKSTTGADILAKNEDTDFMLLQLTDDPANNGNVTVYYLGWDKRDVPSLYGACIHHPLGTPKKIATTVFELEIWPKTIDWKNPETGVVVATSLPYTHWSVIFTDGLVLPISSGSPFINQDKRVIGQLHGGGGWCWPDPNLFFFGRLDLSWGNGQTADTRLKDWLDPLNIDPPFIDGKPGCTKNLINQNITDNKTIKGCETLNVENVNILYSVKVNLNAEEVVNIYPNFHAAYGTKVHINIVGRADNIPLSNPYYSVVNQVIEDNSLPFFATNNTDNSKKNYDFFLSPNPNSGAFKIETNFPVTEVAHLKITNTLGVPVYETQTLVSNEIQLPNASAGLYFVVVVLNDGTLLNQKMMIQR